jgi:hypothetical protein
MRTISIAYALVISIMLLSAKVSAMDDNTKQGIVTFSSVTAMIFILAAFTQPDNAELTLFNYAKFEIGGNTPMDGNSALCGNGGKLTSSGEIRFNTFEYGVFYGDVIPWLHRSCVAEKDKFVIDTYAFRIGAERRF